MNTINKRLIILASLVTFALAIPFVNEGRTMAQPNNQLPAGLVSRWPADGDTLDVVGTNHGTLVNGTTFDAGKSGQAFSLDGIDDIVDLGANNIIGSGTMPFSVATWIYPTSVPESGFYYFTIRLKQDTQFFVAFTNDFQVGGAYVVATFRGTTHQWLTPVDLPSLVNQWTHVAVTYNGGDKSSASSYAVFLNGTQLPIGTVDLGPVGGDCNDNALGSDAGPSCIGDNDPGNTHFQGLIDEVQIYNRALSPAEIQNVYNFFPLVPFATFAADAKLDLGPGANDDALTVKGSFTLGPASNEIINPLTEDVNLKVGAFSTTIPAGSFTQDPAGTFQFAGVTLKVQITSLGGNAYDFKADGIGADLAGTVLPVTVELTIGDDSDSITLKKVKVMAD